MYTLNQWQFILRNTNQSELPENAVVYASTDPAEVGRFLASLQKLD